MVNITFRGIQIFCRFFIVCQYPATKAQYPSAHTVYREHDPPLKAIKGLTVLRMGSILLDDGESGFLQIFQLIPFIQGRSGKSVPLIKAIAQIKLPDSFVRKAPFLKISKSDRLSLLPFPQDFGKILFGKI